MKLRDRVAQLEADLADSELRLEEYRNAFDTLLRRAIEARLTELLDNPDQLRALILERANAASKPSDLMAALRALAVMEE